MAGGLRRVTRTRIALFLWKEVNRPWPEALFLPAQASCDWMGEAPNADLEKERLIYDIGKNNALYDSDKLYKRVKRGFDIVFPEAD